MKNKTVIFKNKECQSFLDKNGYIILDLFSSEQVIKLQDLYAQKVAESYDSATPLYESSRANDYKSNEYIADQIAKIVQPEVERYFINVHFFGGVFFVKPSSSNEEIPLHQDWNIVDENEGYSLLMWCPLLDITKDNGALYTLDGSHRYFDETYRSANINPTRFPMGNDSFFKEHLTTHYLKRGQVICYQYNLFHGSWPNQSKEDRLNCTGCIISENIGFKYYHKVDENQIDVYDVDARFYLEGISTLVEGGVPEGYENVERQIKSTQSVTYQSLKSKFIAQKTDN